VVLVSRKNKLQVPHHTYFYAISKENIFNWTDPQSLHITLKISHIWNQCQLEAPISRRFSALKVFCYFLLYPPKGHVPNHLYVFSYIHFCICLGGTRMCWRICSHSVQIILCAIPSRFRVGFLNHFMFLVICSFIHRINFQMFSSCFLTKVGVANRQFFFYFGCAKSCCFPVYQHSETDNVWQTYLAIQRQVIKVQS
jgi:hypothetical protein